MECNIYLNPEFYSPVIGFRKKQRETEGGDKEKKKSGGIREGEVAAGGL